MRCPPCVMLAPRQAVRPGASRTVVTMAAGEKKYKLVLLRHGESTWNEENRFTGWYDCPLSTKGVQEAKEAGQALKVRTTSLFQDPCNHF